MRRVASTGFCLVFAVLGIAGCNDRADAKTDKLQNRDNESRTVVRQEPIQPLPKRVDVDAALAALGEKLFHEKRLSSDGTIACASCHDIANGGDDGKARSVGVGGKQGGVNAPTVLNSGNSFVQFWDGRAKTLEDQVDGPVQNPLEMAAEWQVVVKTIAADETYRKEFAALFPDGVTHENIRIAIATFERTLNTPSRFDAWLLGDSDAITPQELKGYELFKNVGCVACHQGRNVGGNMFQRFGVMGDYFKDRGNVAKDDYGRFNVTGEEADRFVFKVPSLRNVERTAPYFHDGSRATLEEAVRTMARYQLGRQLPDGDVQDLLAFLKSLSGELPERYRNGGKGS